MAKERTTELAAQIRKAVHLHDPVAKACIDLVKEALDDAKDSLVLTDGEDMLRTQGTARYLTKLYRELTTVPPNINPQEQ